jgi:Kef-type K+ transport system membrane component KefB
MQQELAFKAITQGTIGVIFLTLLLGLLFTLRQDIQRKKRLGGIVIFALSILGLWCFLAFAEVYFSLHEFIASQYTTERTGTLSGNTMNP